MNWYSLHKSATPISLDTVDFDKYVAVGHPGWSSDRKKIKTTRSFIYIIDKNWNFVDKPVQNERGIPLRDTDTQRYVGHASFGVDFVEAIASGRYEVNEETKSTIATLVLSDKATNLSIMMFKKCLEKIVEIINTKLNYPNIRLVTKLVPWHEDVAREIL